MAPKKNAVGREELAEIRETLDFMSEELSTVAKQQALLLALMDDIKQLKQIIQEKDAKINGLESRIDQLEQYSRIEDVIVTGLKTTHRSYASVARVGDANEETPTAEQQTLERQVIHFFETQKINVQSANIAACHTLPRKDKNAKPAIILRFVNRKHKVELMKQFKKLDGTGVFLNEHLTKKNADIAYQARQLKKQKKIQGTWTRNCKVMIQLNGETPEEAKVVMIREVKDLVKYT